MKKIYFVLSLVFLCAGLKNVNAQIAAWDFTGAATPVTFAATTFNANLVAAAGANNITRGPGAAASAGGNSFRTVGFQNNGISTANTDYFQITLTAATGYTVSLSTIDARLAGTASYCVAPGVSQQFAYSLDGTNFTLIGTPQATIGTPGTLTQIDVTGIGALQNVAAGTTVTLRYYASGQTTTGGWGFNSPAATQNGLAIGGSVTPASGTPNIVVNPTSRTGFLSTVSVPSAEQSYDVSGTDLTGDITITPPAGYEISTGTGGGFVPTNPITLTPGGGTVPVTPIYIRMNSAVLGVNAGNITNTSAGSNNPNVSLSGNVIDAEPTAQGAITVGTVTNNSIEVTLTAGNGAKQLLVVHAVTPVVSTPADATSYTANTVYAGGSNLGANTYVVYNGVSGNGGAPITITGLAVATQYHFAVYEFNDGGGTAGAANYLLTTPGTANATTLNIVNTYIWSGANSTLWTDPLNWLPARISPSTNDSLLFVGPLTVTVTGVPAETIGYLGISLGSSVTLQAAVNNTTLNIGAGFVGEELELDNSSQLNISGANAYTINLPTGNSSILDGSMTFTGGAHKLTAADAGGITFNTGASFTAGTGFSGNAFGTTNLNSVVFISGSVYNQVAGGNPFGAGQPNSVVVFQTGSLFRMLGNLAPSLSGRTYADLEIDNAAFSQSGTGGGALSIDNLTITQGLLLGLNTTGGISIKGNINTVAGSTLNFLSASANTVTFDGTAAQAVNIGGTFGWSGFESLTINNAAGVDLNRDITLGATTTLALTAGILKLNAPATMITLSAGTTLTGGNSNASYVDGKVRKIGNTDFTFPVGKTGFGYVPIGVSNFAGAPVTDEFTAEYVRGNARLLGPVTAIGLDHVSGCDYWTLDKTGSATATDITAYWSANNVCNGTYIDVVADVVIAHFDGTNWNAFGTIGTAAGLPAAGNVVWTGVTAFSPFSLGSTSLNNPLPITINYFTGLKQSGGHLLNWKVTCTNTPTVNIVLERSSDGRNYTSVHNIAATALQCQQPFSYTDANPAKGVNYYRLKLTDANGKTTYSSVVSLINAASGIDILNITPNPIVGGTFNLKLSAAQKTNMEVMITDMQGRMLQKQVVNAVAGFNVVPVDVRNLSAGTYQLVGYSNEGRTRILRFVIQ
ncbi:MAG TPA: T9SS type A sorting domain-containing protein [Ferruginibacter sp.]|nr:T9SS type A sorting domain-containing protein [Ferruginibacter sp.]